MATFIQLLLAGIALGSVYALISLGYTMVYGIIKLINFAHGDIYMVGAYIAFVVVTNLKLGIIPAFLISMILCGALGVVIEKIAYKPVRNSSRISALITAIGVSFFLEYGMKAIAGADYKTYPNNLLPDTKFIFLHGKVVVNIKDIIVIGTSLILMLVLQYIVKRTKIGKAMRALSQDQDAAQLMGINVDNVISFTFALGSAMAGAAGVLVGIYYNSIDPLMGIQPGLKAFIAAVFGGIGIIPGAMVGGLSMGVIESMVSGYGSSMYKDAVAFVILIVILIIKPTGLFGKNIKEKV